MTDRIRSILTFGNMLTFQRIENLSPKPSPTFNVFAQGASGVLLPSSGMPLNKNENMYKGCIMIITWLFRFLVVWILDRFGNFHPNLYTQNNDFKMGRNLLVHRHCLPISSTLYSNKILDSTPSPTRLVSTISLCSISSHQDKFRRMWISFSYALLG